MAAVNVAAILRWYESHARDLPWRRATASPWAVLVSEVMLQQTPVARVRPAYEAWLARWPTPPALAADSPADAVRQWGRLGYPRRALRLHAAAQVISERHGGEVPSSFDALLALPGVGSYTAAAVASFAFGQRHPVLDTNVRRVLARMAAGQQWPARSTSAAEIALARSLLPARPEVAARWSVAVMELGALVCTAARPRCAACPVADGCAWRRAGSPAGDGRRGSQPYQGTDRQCRGRLLAILRDSDGPVPPARLDAAWPDAAQRGRALASLIADGLAEPHPGGGYALPAHQPTLPAHPTALPAHPTASAGHPTGPTGHPTGPTGHPTGPAGHPTGPAGHPTASAGHPTASAGHPPALPAHPPALAAPAQPADQERSSAVTATDL